MCVCVFGITTDSQYLMSEFLYEHSSVMILSIHNIHVKFIQVYTHDTGVYTLGTATMLPSLFPP